MRIESRGIIKKLMQDNEKRECILSMETTPSAIEKRLIYFDKIRKRGREEEKFARLLFSDVVV